MTALGIDGGQSGLRLRQVGTDEVVEAATVSQADDDLASAYAASLRAVLPAQAVGLVRAVAGLSAIPDDDAGRRRLAEVLRSVTGAEQVWLTGDAVTAHRAAFAGGQGVVLAAGTGVACLALDDLSGAPHHVDGAGYLIDDDGGAFRIGSAGLRAAVRAHDGRGPATSLLARACDQFETDAADLAAAVHRRSRAVTDVAGFARIVLDESTRDGAAGLIVLDAADALVRTVRAALVLAGADAPLAIGGRLLADGSPLRTAFLAALATARLGKGDVTDAPSPLDGACAFATDTDPGRYAPLVLRLEGPPSLVPGLVARDYLALAAELVHAAGDANGAAIDAAADAIADCVAGGGLVHTFGTGHSHLLAEELFYRAGGIAAVDPILVEPLMLHAGAVASTEQERRTGYAAEILAAHDVRQGDVMLIASNSGGNRVSTELAALSRERGAVVIAVTSLAHATSPLARAVDEPRLHELADIVLDNGGAPGDAAVTVPGMTTAVGPTSTVVGAAILQAVVAEAVARLVARGVDPGVFRSANTTGGDAANAALVAQFSSRVRAL
jgi:uncharacterized phosphosugar-binding protein/N-acetylglucosamine kinase-like BadF-type ATPase